MKCSMLRQSDVFWNLAILAIERVCVGWDRDHAFGPGGASLSFTEAFAMRTRCSRYSYFCHSSSSADVIWLVRLFSINSDTRADGCGEGRLIVLVRRRHR